MTWSTLLSHSYPINLPFLYIDTYKNILTRRLYFQESPPVSSTAETVTKNNYLLENVDQEVMAETTQQKHHIYHDKALKLQMCFLTHTLQYVALTDYKIGFKCQQTELPHWALVVLAL